MLFKRVRKISADRRGGTAIEYGLIAALVVITMIAALKGMASQTTGMWNNVNDKIQAARSGQ